MTGIGIALAALAFAVALASVHALGHLVDRQPSDAERVSSLDGLRGYLAFAVFLHHAAIWYFSLQTGKWELPPSHLYTHFGQSSVSLFFMITGFLFFSRVINARTKPIDWWYLFVSRILRLTPMYLAAVAVMLVIVMFIAGWSLRTPADEFAKSLLRWLAFSIPGTPDLNNVDRTRHILAGVTWTLAYEWFFYVSLPLIALFWRRDVSLGWLAISCCFIAGILTYWTPDYIPMSCFLGGMASALLVRAKRLKKLLMHSVAAFLACSCMVILVTYFPTAEGLPQVLMLSLTFLVVAAGNTLFGFLTWRPSVLLGEITYSVYLLHGAVLFIWVHFILGREFAASLSLLQYWLCILLVIPVLILTCAVSFVFIERPAIQAARPVALRMSKKLGRTG